MKQQPKKAPTPDQMKGLSSARSMISCIQHSASEDVYKQLDAQSTLDNWAETVTFEGLKKHLSIQQILEFSQNAFTTQNEIKGAINIELRKVALHFSDGKEIDTTYFGSIASTIYDTLPRLSIGDIVKCFYLVKTGSIPVGDIYSENVLSWFAQYEKLKNPSKADALEEYKKKRNELLDL